MYDTMISHDTDSVANKFGSDNMSGNILETLSKVVI